MLIMLNYLCRRWILSLSLSPILVKQHKAQVESIAVTGLQHQLSSMPYASTQNGGRGRGWDRSFISVFATFFCLSFFFSTSCLWCWLLCFYFLVLGCSRLFLCLLFMFSDSSLRFWLLRFCFFALRHNYTQFTRITSSFTYLCTSHFLWGLPSPLLYLYQFFCSSIYTRL